MTPQIIKPITVGLDIQSAPRLLKGHRNRRGIGPADDLGYRVTYLHVVGIKRLPAAALLLRIQVSDCFELVARVRLREFQLLVFAFLLSGHALDTHAPRVRLSEFAPVSIEITDQRNLLEHAASEAARQFRQIRESHLRIDALTHLDRLVPAPMRSREEGMHAGQAAAVSNRNTAVRIKLARRRQQAAMTRGSRICFINE